MYHFINDPELPKKLATSEAMTVLGKINKDFYCTMVFIKLLCQEVCWSFSRIGKHIESVYKPFL
jgi:hypothetical protein